MVASLVKRAHDAACRCMDLGMNIFIDPGGRRLELAFNAGAPEMTKHIDGVKRDMTEEWGRTQKAPGHARRMHDGSYANAGAKS